MTTPTSPLLKDLLCGGGESVTASDVVTRSPSSRHATHAELNAGDGHPGLQDVTLSTPTTTTTILPDPEDETLLSVRPTLSTFRALSSSEIFSPRAISDEFSSSSLPLSRQIFSPPQSNGHPLQQPLLRVGSMLIPRPVEQAAILRSLLAINKESSRAFVLATPERVKYRHDFPSTILILTCMDGRVNIESSMHVPTGALVTWRSLGGVFEPGWPAAVARLQALRSVAQARGRAMIALVAYHYSKGVSSNCAGHGYDTGRARDAAVKLVETLTFCNASGDLASFTAITCSFETDDELLTLENSTSGAVLPSTDVVKEPVEAIKAIFPALLPSAVRDLRPLLLGNGNHVLSKRPQNKVTSELEHKERVIFVGSSSSTDWLAIANFALCLDDADPRLGEAIAAASHLVLRNLEREEASGEHAGALVVCAAAYVDAFERNAAIVSARYLTRLAREVIARTHSTVVEHVFEFVTAVTSDSRKLELVSEE